MPNPTVHHRFHNSPVCVPILSQINPVHKDNFYFFNIFIHSHLCLGLPSGSLPSKFPSYTPHMPLFSPVHTPALSPQHVAVRTMTLFTMHFSAYCYFLLLRPKYASLHPVLEDPQYTTIPNLTHQVWTRRELQAHSYRVYFNFCVFAQYTRPKKILNQDVQAFPKLNIFLMSSKLQFLFSMSFSNIWTFITFQKDLLAIFMLWYFLHCAHDMWTHTHVVFSTSCLTRNIYCKTKFQ